MSLAVLEDVNRCWSTSFQVPMHEVIVVGTRCAGAAAARLLARRGHSVLMLDRAHFPSDTISTHCVTLGGVTQLRRWGLLDRVLATNVP